MDLFRDEQLMGLQAPYRMMHIVQRPAGYVLAAHNHEDYYHIDYISEGWMCVEFENNEYVVKEGQAVILPPRKNHAMRSYVNYTQIGMDMYEKSDDRGIYDLFCETYPDGFAIVTLVDFTKSFNELYTAFRHLNKLNRLKIANAVESLLLATIERSRNVKNQDFKQQFIDCISKDKTYCLSLDKISQYMGMSKTHLGRLVRREFGCGVIEYCNQLKLSKACLLLQTTDLPIKSICDDLLFYDPSHFYNFFKKHMGITPHQYKTQSRGVENNQHSAMQPAERVL